MQCSRKKIAASSARNDLRKKRVTNRERIELDGYDTRRKKKKNDKGKINWGP